MERKANQNFLIHQYDEINRELTWLTLAKDLPAWKTSLTVLFDAAAAAIDGGALGTDLGTSGGETERFS